MMPPTQHIRLLAEGLEPLVEAAGDYPVFATILDDWRDRLRSWFRSPDPVVEVERSVERSELKIHLGGEASPARGSDEPMTLSAFVSALRKVPPEAASDPIVVSMSLALPEQPETRLTLNVPTRSVTCRVERRRGRVVLSFRSAVGAAQRRAAQLAGGSRS